MGTNKICILLIDDDEATNFLHEIVIDKSNVARSVIVKTTGKSALEYLSNTDQANHEIPDMIFLDINMPVMNGWQFIDYYKELTSSLIAKTKLIMLTTSSNIDDRKRAEEIKEIDHYLTKPLEEKNLIDLKNKYFPDPEA